MSVGNLKDQGNKGNNLPFQLRTLQLLDAINLSITSLPGVDHESRTSTYEAIANGIGYSIGDIIIRYDIIDLGTGLLESTIWFNDTLQTQLVPAPLPGDLTPISAPSGVTVLNGPAGAAVNIQDGGNSITVDGTVTANAGTGNFTVVQATASNLNTTVGNAAGAAAVNIQDGGNVISVDDNGGSITVDGTVAATQSGAWSVTNLANPGVNIGDVTVNNAAGASAVNIQDGGNVISVDDAGGSLTVDGTVAATQSGTWNINNISGTISLPTGASTEATLLNIYNNTLSKMNRIRGAANYTRAFTYTGGGDVNTITHTGTTLLGLETIVETFSYSGGNVSLIVYS